MEACTFLVYTAQAPGCSAGVLSQVGPVFCALPGSTVLRFSFSGAPQGHRLGGECVSCPSQLRRPGAWWAHCPRWIVCLNHLPSPGRSVSWEVARTLSQVCLVSLGSWSQTASLLADVSQPRFQEDVVSNWEPAHSLVEDASLRGWDCPLPASSGCRMHASLPPAWGRALYTAG